MTSTSALHRKYTTWLAEPMSADELSLFKATSRAATCRPTSSWLDGFIREWNDAAEREDAGEDEDDA